MVSPDPLLPPDAVSPVSASDPQQPPVLDVLPWNLWDVLRIVVVALITIGLFSMIAMAIAGHGTKSHDVLESLARDPRIQIPAQVAAYLVVIGYMVAIVRMGGRPFWTTVRWNFPARAAVGYAALGIALSILVAQASALLPIPKSLPIDSYFRSATGAYLMAAFGVTFAPFVEELFFRGFLYPVLARKLGVGASVGVTALCFALIHEAQLAHAWAPLLLLWFVGLVLTAVRAWTNSVGASFCIHAGYNATLFALMYQFTDHFRHLEKLS